MPHQKTIHHSPPNPAPKRQGRELQGISYSSFAPAAHGLKNRWDFRFPFFLSVFCLLTFPAPEREKKYMFTRDGEWGCGGWRAGLLAEKEICVEPGSWLRGGGRPDPTALSRQGRVIQVSGAGGKLSNSKDPRSPRWTPGWGPPGPRTQCLPLCLLPPCLPCPLPALSPSWGASCSV